MIFKFFQDLIIFIITLGILITVHEFGHFFAARLLKIRVERFSIGFGPVLRSWKDSSGTEYVISIILFGGYVKLSDINNKQINHNKSNNNLFHYKQIWKRILIIIAGPIFNFIFSIILYIAIYSIGVPDYKPIVSYVFPNSIASQLKILPGSKINSINNIQVNNWKEVRLQILNNINKKIFFVSTETIDSNNNVYLETHITYLPSNWFNQVVVNNINDPLVIFGVLPNVLCVKSFALKLSDYIFDQQDNLKINDKILLINKEPIYDHKSFVQSIVNNPETIFTLTIARNDQILNWDCLLYKNKFSSEEEMISRIYSFLNNITFIEKRTLEISQYGFKVAILKALNQTRDLICVIINAFIQIITGNTKTNNLHGPLAIAQGASQAIHSGLIYYLIFLAVISINLGIVNLFPIPILDGGQLLFLLIEKITGNPISERLQNFICIIGLIILMLLMSLALYNDVSIRL